MNAETHAPQPAPHWLQGRISSWIFGTDHKRIGMIWLGVGGFGLVLGGILSLVAALQTSTSNLDVIGQGTYASVITMGGTLLTYGGVLPLALGLAVVLVPLQLGSRGIVLPGLSAVALWLGVSGVVAVVLSSFAKGDAPRSTWTTAPAAALAARPGETVRLAGLLLIGVATLLTAIALIATIRGPRASGMTNERLPLFTRSVGVISVALLVLAPLSVLGSALLLLERKHSGSFDWYITSDGSLLGGYGWVFSQAIVAVTVVLAIGVAAEIVATFGRDPLGPRRLATLSLVATAVLVALVPSFDTVDSRRWAGVVAFLACIPVAAVAGALLLAALDTLRAGRPPGALLLAIGSLVLLFAATMVSLVLVVAHNSLHGTTFETARLDLLWTGVLLALLAGVAYWWPKLTGRKLDDRAVSGAAVILLGSSLLLALGRAIAGIADQPLNAGVVIGGAGAGGVLGALGALGIAGGILLFVPARLGARRVGSDPWLADTLEWYTDSPPPAHNFDSLPPVKSERPLHDLRRQLEDRNAL